MFFGLNITVNVSLKVEKLSQLLSTNADKLKVLSGVVSKPHRARCESKTRAPTTHCQTHKIIILQFHF